MKKTFMTLTLVLGLITFINAQGITNTLGGNTANDKFIVENSDSEVGLVITGKGNVGIGTFSPISQLHIINDINSPLSLRLHNPNTGKGAATIIYFDGSNHAGISVFGSGFDGDENVMRIFNNRNSPDGSIDFVVKGEKKLVIDNIGNIGIGTANPQLKLHVVGSQGEGTPPFINGTLLALQQNSNYRDWAHLAIIAGTAGRASLNFGDKNDDDSGALIYDNVSNSMRFYTNAIPQLVIDKSGNVGIGSNTPHSKLHVVSSTISGADNTAKFEALGIGSNASHIHYGTKGDWYIRSAAYDGKVVIQDSGGNVGIGTNNPEAKLHVEGSVKVGVNGLVYSEIIELTGTTNTSYVNTYVNFPTGYNMNNTRILTCEIYNSNNAWISMGEHVGVNMGLGGPITITHPDHSMYQDKPYRMVLMRVE